MKNVLVFMLIIITAFPSYALDFECEAQYAKGIHEDEIKVKLEPVNDKEACAEIGQNRFMAKLTEDGLLQLSVYVNALLLAEAQWAMPTDDRSTHPDMQVRTGEKEGVRFSCWKARSKRNLIQTEAEIGK